jgi:hypothetical protein
VRPGGLRTTIVVNQAGEFVHVETGQYDSLRALDDDIDTHVVGGV